MEELEEYHPSVSTQGYSSSQWHTQRAEYPLVVVVASNHHEI
jgi:hypothetical protein